VRAAFCGDGTVRAAWDEVAQLLSITGKPKAASPAVLSEHETEGLDRSSPQAQAELLLERAITTMQEPAIRFASSCGWLAWACADDPIFEFSFYDCAEF